VTQLQICARANWAEITTLAARAARLLRRAVEPAAGSRSKRSADLGGSSAAVGLRGRD